MAIALSLGSGSLELLTSSPLPSLAAGKTSDPTRWSLAVPTKMGGPSALDDFHQGCVTQAWLATSEDELARSTGGYFLSSTAACAE
jgi:hypothetical protein